MHKSNVLSGVQGHGSNLELRQPGVRARIGVAAGHHPSFGSTDGERDSARSQSLACLQKSHIDRIGLERATEINDAQNSKETNLNKNRDSLTS